MSSIRNCPSVSVVVLKVPLFPLRRTPAPWIGTPAASRSTPCQRGSTAFCASIPVENRKQATTATTRFLEYRLFTNCEAWGFAFASFPKDSSISFLKSSAALYYLSRRRHNESAHRSAAGKLSLSKNCDERI